MKIEKIGQIAIPVDDMDRAVAFYRDILGLRFLFSAGPNLSFFDCGGVRIYLSRPEPEFAQHSSVIYFTVADIKSEFESVRQYAEGEPHVVAKLPDREVWMAFFRDPDRNLLALMSEVPL